MLAYINKRYKQTRHHFLKNCANFDISSTFQHPLRNNKKGKICYIHTTE